MPVPVFKLSVFFLLLCFASLKAGICHAQIVPDTALTKPIPDVVQAKADTTINADSAIAEMPAPLPFEPNPKRAGLYAAILPGAGQVYNRQYWKVPLVLAGVGVIGYFFQDNLKFYQNYRKGYLQRVQNPDNRELFPEYEQDQLRQLQENYRKNMDMTVLFGVVVYAAQILDAVASAHLKNFDVSRDISMNMSPVVYPNGIGVGIVFRMK